MYVNTDTLQYPISERDIHRALPNTSFGKPFIAPAPYAWVFPAPQPTFDPITHSVQEAAPALANGRWEQRWALVAYDAATVTENRAAATVALRASLLQQVAVKRDTVLSGNVAYTFGTVVDAVQTRPQDQVNLIVIRDNARDAMAAGVITPVLEFRALSDTSYWLTPQQVLDMTSAVRTFGYEVYKASWDLKGQIEAATTLAELQAIDITTGWPT